VTSPLSSKAFRIGTRRSALARWQADWVADALRARGANVVLVPIVTRGDTDQAQPLGAIGGDGLFTKELQRALLADEIDLAVHSLKDLPTEHVPGLIVAATPERAPTADALVSRDSSLLADLPAGAKIGTGSLRRRAQLWHARSDLAMHNIRGNVDTRLRKLEQGEYDAIVLAEAGLTRLGLDGRITERLASPLMLPAVGQGALGLECREQDAETRAALAGLDHAATHFAVLAERALMRELAGGCLAPIAALGTVGANGQLQLSAVVLSGDGKTRLAAEGVAPTADAEALGQRVAKQLAAQGALELIDAVRRKE
jgi:hydroxymethylbilane synthase